MAEDTTVLKEAPAGRVAEAAQRVPLLYLLAGLGLRGKGILVVVAPLLVQTTWGAVAVGPEPLV
jgi:hypothetical protein